MYFHSKKDMWIGSVIWLGMVIPFIAFLFDSIWLGVLIMIPIVILTGWVWFGTFYAIDNDNLNIKCGPFREKIPLKDIKNIRETRNAASSAALSLDRIEIKYGRNKKTIISPVKKSEFIGMIKSKCPDVNINVDIDVD